jgi:NAD(P)-dependent dehydrogenase (short-subunit alcohol dehydrogenase family)
MSGELDGKVAIVTGAAGGIGRETSRVLAGAGAKVVLADLPEADLEGAAAAAGGEVAHHPVDISDEASVRALMQFTVKAFGRLDVIDNNATIGGSPGDGLVADLTVEVWDSTFAVNARGAMLMCKHAIPPMIEGGGGSIVNISSGTAQGGDDFATSYAASKAAVESLTRYVATQYGLQGIRCNAIAPGLVRTPLLEASLPPPIVEIFTGHKLVGRIGEPRDIAELVCFLASDRAAYITGQVIAADGGFRAHVPSLAEVRKFATQQHEES